jgi:hypothetical protein
MPLSFTATPIGALAARSRPAGSDGAGVRAPLAVAGAKALPELVGADTSDVAPARAPATGADTAGRAGVAAAGTAVSAGVNVVARDGTAGR